MAISDTDTGLAPAHPAGKRPGKLGGGLGRLIRSRLAPWSEIQPLLAVAVVLVHSWSVLRFLPNVSSWLFHLSVWDVLGIFAYAQVYAMLESLSITSVVLLLAALLPARWLRAQLAARGSALLLVNAAWAIAVHFTEKLPLWPSKRFMLAAVVYAGTLAAVPFLTQRSQRLERLLASLADRCQVLLYVYVPLAALCVIVIIIRNL